MSKGIPTVCLEITSFQFCIGGEHFYGKLKYYSYPTYKTVEVTHRLTKKEADYLNEKDGLTREGSYGFHWKAGVKSERFHSRAAVVAAARKQWRRVFPKAVLLTKGLSASGDPQRALEGPRALKKEINALVEEAESFGRWANEKKMKAVCRRWEKLLNDYAVKLRRE